METFTKNLLFHQRKFHLKIFLKFHKTHFICFKLIQFAIQSSLLLSLVNMKMNVSKIKKESKKNKKGKEDRRNGTFVNFIINVTALF